MMNKIKQNKIMTIASIFALVGILSIAYAVFTSNLNINGTGINRKSNYDIYFNNVSNFLTSGTAQVSPTTPTNQNHTTVIEDYNATLLTPGDSIYFTFDIVNDGDYDATLSSLTLGPVKCSVNGNENDQSAQNVCQNIEYTIRYADNSTLQPNNDKLLSKETKSVKVTLTYKDTITADKLPTSNVTISNLGIEMVYEADSEAKTNPDGSTPLKTYTIGEELTFKNEKYNIIGQGDDYVTLLKQEPLTVDEVNTYGEVNTDKNHVNMYVTYNKSASYYHQAYNQNGYGGMAYYSGSACGFIESLSKWLYSGCTTYYNSSEVKHVVDNWVSTKFTNELKTVDGYAARLIKIEELKSNFYPSCSPTATYCFEESTTPSWLYNSNYWYWTMSRYSSPSDLWRVCKDGSLGYYDIYNYYGVVRPVINVYKSAIQN